MKNMKRKYLVLIFAIISTIIFSLITSYSHPPPPPSLPIDGGAIFFLLFGEFKIILQ